MKEINAILKIVNKMGWQKMPAEVAIDAIKQAVINASCILHEENKVVSIPEVLECLTRPGIKTSTIWVLLFVNNSKDLDDIKVNTACLAMRWEIEACLRKGMSLEAARREWDI